jgi:flagellar basal body-associated protein FliL
MKTLNNLLIPLFAIILSTAAMSYTVSMVGSSTEKLRKEISEKLKNIDIRNYNTSDYDIKVQFTINDENEMVVLKTDHEVFDHLIKNTLNYKSIEVKDVKRNSLYIINVKLKTSMA